MRAILLAFLMVFSTQASAEFMTYHDLKNLKYVDVILMDKAKNACWTNLTETRQYAEEKLRSVNAKLFSSDSYEKVPAEYYALVVKVMSRRSEVLQLCYGSIYIYIATPFNLNSFWHEAQAVGYEAIFMGKQNINSGVIESVQAFFDQSKSGYQRD